MRTNAIEKTRERPRGRQGGVWRFLLAGCWPRPVAAIRTLAALVASRRQVAHRRWEARRARAVARMVVTEEPLPRAARPARAGHKVRVARLAPVARPLSIPMGPAGARAAFAMPARGPGK
jgi:hypothetical protein